MHLRVLDPRSRPRLLWAGIMMALLLENAIAIPFHAVFDRALPVETSAGFLLVLDALFLVELAFEARTAVARHGVFIAEPGPVARWYLRRRLLFDLLCNFPYDIILVASGRVGALEILALAHLPRLLRLPRVFSVLRPIWTRLQIHPSVFRLVALLVWMVLVVHWIGCGWFWIGMDAGEEGWVHAEGLEGAPVRTQYLRSAYWSITTIATVGYGDITPRTDAETVFAMAMMGIGVALFGYVIGNMATLLGNIDSRASAYRQRIEAVTAYMRRHRLPANLQERVLAHFEHLWDRSRGLDDTRILDDLPNYLRQEVLLFLNRDLIEKVPLFGDCDRGFIHSLIPRLKPVVCVASEYIIREGDVGREMYFLTRGIVDVFSEDGEIHATYSEGSYFGEIALLFPDRRAASVRAKTYCDLFVLEKKDFDEILAEHPEFGEKILRVAKERYGTVRRPRPRQ